MKKNINKNRNHYSYLYENNIRVQFFVSQYVLQFYFTEDRLHG